MSGHPLRALIAWEGGAGRGHLLLLRALVHGLGPGFVFDAGLCRMDHAEILRPLCDLVFPAAYMWERPERRIAAGGPRVANWAEFLGDVGLADPQFLIRQIGWWMEVLRTRASRLLIATYAPSAMLAARIMGIPVVSTGVGYSTPPGHLAQLPIYLPDHATRIYDEAELSAAVNVALSHHGGAPIERFAQIYDVGAQFARTIAGLDPYAQWRDRPYIPPMSEPVHPAAEQGDELLMYFAAGEQDDPVLMSVIEDLPVPRRLYLPGIDPALAERLTAKGISVEPAVMPPALVGQRTRLLLHAGNHGMICLGFALGLPQLAIPRHMEHLYHATRASEMAPLDIVSRHERDPAVIRAAILGAYHDASRQRAARDFAPVIAPQLFGDRSALIRASVLPLLG